MWLGGQLEAGSSGSIWTVDAAAVHPAAVLLDAPWPHGGFVSDEVALSHGIVSDDGVQYTVDNYLNAPLYPEFDDLSFPYLQQQQRQQQQIPDLFIDIEPSTSTTPPDLFQTSSSTPQTHFLALFPDLTTHPHSLDLPQPTPSIYPVGGGNPSTSSTAVSPLPVAPMELTPPPHRNSPDGSLSYGHHSSAANKRHRDEPTDVVLRRQRNTLAARKYRQKRIDRISDLEEEVDKLKGERDELRIKLARQEAETMALREMLRAKGDA